MLNTLFTELAAKVAAVEKTKADRDAKLAHAMEVRYDARMNYDQAIRDAGAVYKAALASVDDPLTAADATHATAVKQARDAKAALDAALQETIPNDNAAQAKVY